MGTTVGTHINQHSAARAESRIYNEEIAPQFATLVIFVDDVEHCFYFTGAKNADALARAATAINEAIAALAPEV